MPQLTGMPVRPLLDLRREITRGLKLTHPGIVRLFDLHEDPGQGLAAIAMEYVDGSTLADQKAKQPERCFEVAEPLIGWVRSLCDALAYIHEEARVIHRDLKPRNVMLTAGGRLKVADFGIAATLSDSHSRLTQHPGSSGTPVYMSPQQALGRQPAAADDIYSLGATIYELITSKPPFFRGEMAVILNQVATEKPPSMMVRRSELNITSRAPIPLVWEKTISACLAKNPAERPSSVREFAARLGLGEQGIPAARSRDGSTAVGMAARWKTVAAVVCILSVLSIAGWWWISRSGQSSEERPTRHSIAKEQQPASAVRPESGGTPAPGAEFRSAENVVRELEKPRGGDEDGILDRLGEALVLATASNPPHKRTGELWNAFLRKAETIAAKPHRPSSPEKNVLQLRVSGAFALSEVLALPELPLDDRRKLIPIVSRIAEGCPPADQVAFASFVMKGLAMVDPVEADRLRLSALEALRTLPNNQNQTLMYLSQLARGPMPDSEARLTSVLQVIRSIPDSKTRFKLLSTLPKAFYLLSPASTERYHQAIHALAVESPAAMPPWGVGDQARAAARDGNLETARKLAELSKGPTAVKAAELSEVTQQAAFLPVRRAALAGDLDAAVRELRALPAQLIWLGFDVDPMVALAIERKDLVIAREAILRCEHPQILFENLVRELLAQGAFDPAERVIQEAQQSANATMGYRSVVNLAVARLAAGQEEKARAALSSISAKVWADPKETNALNTEALVALARLKMTAELTPWWNQAFQELEKTLQKSAHQAFNYPSLYLSAFHAGWQEKIDRLEALFESHPSAFSGYLVQQIAVGLHLAGEPAKAIPWTRQLPADDPVLPSMLATGFFRAGNDARLSAFKTTLREEKDVAMFWSTIARELGADLRRTRTAGDWKLPPPVTAAENGAFWSILGQESADSSVALNNVLVCSKKIADPHLVISALREAADAAGRCGLLDHLDEILRDIERLNDPAAFDQACRNAAYELLREGNKERARPLVLKIKDPAARFSFLTGLVSDPAINLGRDEEIAMLDQAEALIPALEGFGYCWQTNSRANSAMEAYGLLASLSATQLYDHSAAERRFTEAHRSLAGVPANERFYAAGRLAIHLAAAGKFERARERMKDAAILRKGATVIPVQIGLFWNGVARQQFKSKDRSGAEETLRIAETSLRAAAPKFARPSSFLELALKRLEKPGEETFAKWTAEFAKEEKPEEAMPLLKARQEIVGFLSAENALLAPAMAFGKTLSAPMGEEKFFEIFRGLVKYGKIEEVAQAAERVRLGEELNADTQREAEWDRARAMRLVGQRYHRDMRAKEGADWINSLPSALDQAMAWVGLAEGPPREGF